MSLVTFGIFAQFAAAAAQLHGRFDCNTSYPTPPPPANISELHPAHVDYVVAFGDSITAAFAARSTLLEARDLSWSGGVGAVDQLTLAQLLSFYRPDGEKVLGTSSKAVLPRNVTNLPHGDFHKETDGLNVAESQGAVHRNSMVEQWNLFQGQLWRFGPKFDSGWKVVTIWMTANDVCGQCDGPVDSKFLDSWVAGHDALINNITSTMKNVLINLVSTLDLSNIARIQRSSVFCSLEHRVILQECGCIDRGNETQLKQLDENVHTFNNRLHNLTRVWNARLVANGRTDVRVVQQSFMEEIGSVLDKSFLNDLDCFHPSAEAHETLAIGLWNSMLCTEGRSHRCGKIFTKDIKPVCPGPLDTFYTGPDVIPDKPQI